jgi:hypothetical protein
MPTNFPERKSTPKKRAQAVAWYWANRSKVLEQKKALRLRMGDEAYKERSRRYMGNFYSRNPNYEIEMYQKKKSRLLSEFFGAYGDHCTCCGEKEKTFLTIEHLNGGGRQHRKSLPSGSLAILYDLRRKGWPKDGFTVLCMNCNFGKARNGGKCPHEIKAFHVIRWIADEERKFEYALQRSDVQV